MKYALFAPLLISTHPVFAALNMKPGLWNVKMEMKSGGQKYDPQAQMKKAMAEMPEAQRKQMFAMMNKMKNGAGAGINQDGQMHVCYSQNMLNKPESIAKQEKSKCDTKVVTNTGSKVVTNFKCEDGTKGETTWSISNSETYTGNVNMRTDKGINSEVIYTEKFVSTDCGKIKPKM